MPRRPTSISVVIPVKNDGTDLARCLQALVPQVSVSDEIVVVDNGSSDGSADTARRYGARVLHIDGGGIPAASAAGYDFASGDVIARLDADCVPASDWLAEIRRAFIRAPEVAAITGTARFLDGPRLLRSVLAAIYLGSYFAILTPTLGHVPLFGSNAAFRRDAWTASREHVHSDDEFVHDDLDLSFHLGPRFRIRFDRRLKVSMSMRPFFDSRAMVLRIHRGFHTVLIHWPHHFPPLRWVAGILSSTGPHERPSSVRLLLAPARRSRAR